MRGVVSWFIGLSIDRTSNWVYLRVCMYLPPPPPETHLFMFHIGTSSKTRQLLSVCAVCYIEPCDLSID